MKRTQSYYRAGNVALNTKIKGTVAKELKEENRCSVVATMRTERERWGEYVGHNHFHV
jgi:hypothetical protein